MVGVPCSQWIACSPVRNGGCGRPLNWVVSRHAMDTRTFAATLLKVAGLIICVFTLTKIPSYVPVPTLGDLPADPYSRILIAAINLVPPFLLGLALWFFPGRV